MIDTEIDGNIGWLTINRPDRSNALDVESIVALEEGYRALDADPGVRVVVLRGAGRGFSSGHDLAPKMADATPLSVTEDWDLLLRQNRMLLTIWEGDTPVIAVVHGYCMGHAVELVTVCDLAVTSDDCRFAHPAIRAAGGSPNALTYPFAVGFARAKEYLWVTPELTGREAAEWGFVNRAVTAAELDALTATWARRIASMPPENIRATKRGLRRLADQAGFRLSVEMGADLDALAHTSRATADWRERVANVGLAEAIRQRDEAFR
ncbi:MAG TPA: enoyl-CoA hydratase-related protein [Mycobacterium sp.]